MRWKMYPVKNKAGVVARVESLPLRSALGIFDERTCPSRRNRSGCRDGWLMKGHPIQDMLVKLFNVPESYPSIPKLVASELKIPNRAMCAGKGWA